MGSEDSGWSLSRAAPHKTRQAPPDLQQFGLPSANGEILGTTCMREGQGRTWGELTSEKSAASQRLRVFLSAHLHPPSSSETLFLQRRSQVASGKNPGKAGTEAPCPSRYIPNSGASFITEKPPSLGIAHQSMLDTESLPPPSPGLKMPSYSFGSLTPAPFKQPG